MVIKTVIREENKTLQGPKLEVVEESKSKESKLRTHDPKVKYILEVFGPTSKITTVPGKFKFKDCSAKNCFTTADEDFFGVGHRDKFDAIVIKPGNLRSDKVLKNNNCY